MKRIVLFREGEAKAVAAPRLISIGFLRKNNGSITRIVFIDPNTFAESGSLGKLKNRTFDEWQ